MKLKYEFVLGYPNINVLFISIQDDDKEQSVEMCLHEVDTECEWERQSDHHCEHTAKERRCERKNVFMLRSPRTHERTPGISRNLDDLETNEFADVFGTIAEDLHSARCAQVCFRYRGRQG